MQSRKIDSGMPVGVQEVYLQPGEYFWGGELHRIKTLLGSCVAICVWHPKHRIGGMSHCLLPSRGEDRTDELSGRYIDETFEIFFHEMVRYGTVRSDYQIKVFGGGNMFELREKGGITVGDRNLQTMRDILEKNNMKITAEHVGGKGHRNVIFELWSGDCWVRYGEVKLTGSDTGREKSA
jgi:chemotaxis protein CheD